jgi:hypothetical protein
MKILAINNEKNQRIKEPPSPLNPGEGILDG